MSEQELKPINLNTRVLSLIAHKLRTPLSIVTGYVETVLAQAGKEKFSPFSSKALEEINAQGAVMSQLVSKLVDFSRVNTTQLCDLQKQPILLKPLIKTCASKAIEQENNVLAGFQTDEKTSVKRGTFVEIDCPDTLTLSANEEMLTLCIVELLSNAIKFNNKMEKNIKVQGANHGDCISISVRDYGTGIRPQDVSRIFEPFYQVDDDFTGQVSGWGLGLSMVQRIAQLHKGTVSVVSDRGLGSIFTINFPVV